MKAGSCRSRRRCRFVSNTVTVSVIAISIPTITTTATIDCHAAPGIRNSRRTSRRCYRLRGHCDRSCDILCGKTRRRSVNRNDSADGGANIFVVWSLILEDPRQAIRSQIAAESHQIMVISLSLFSYHDVYAMLFSRQASSQMSPYGMQVEGRVQYARSSGLQQPAAL